MQLNFKQLAQVDNSCTLEVTFPTPLTTRPAWYLAGGTRIDADVARMRKLLQETAFISQWQEQRKASYSQPTAYTVTSLMLHGRLQSVSILYMAIVFSNTSSSWVTYTSAASVGWCPQCYHPCSPVAGRPGAWL